MNRILLLSTLICCFNASAQPVFYGVRNAGNGTIDKVDLKEKAIESVYRFENEGTMPAFSNLVLVGDVYYGTTWYGGTMGYGVIFSIDPVTKAYRVVKNFEHIIRPTGAMVLAADGNLYGMGAANEGVIYRFDLSSHEVNIVHQFDAATGYSNSGNLMIARDGKLYGITGMGGMGQGVIFSFNILNNEYIVEKALVDMEGSAAEGGLIQASNGKLYGMTTTGGKFHAGVVFSFDPVSKEYVVVKMFGGMDGAIPRGNLVEASNGLLYGTTSEGGVYELYGVLFSIDPATNEFTKLVDFEHNAGSGTSGVMVQGKDGKLYGTGGGSLFIYDISTSVFSVQKQSNGPFSWSSNLYVGINGEIFGYGEEKLVYFIPPSDSIYVVKIFDSKNGFSPVGSLLSGSDGKFYGMLRYGGAFGSGGLYAFDPLTNERTILYSFRMDHSPIGNSPELMQSADGKLYWIEPVGYVENTYYNGFMVSYDPVSSDIDTVFKFSEKQYCQIVGGLVQTADGLFYGLDGQGGGDGPVIFSVSVKDQEYKIRYTLNEYDVGSIYQGFTLASNGKLYSMSTFGLQTIFYWDPGKAEFKKIREFRDDQLGLIQFGPWVEGPDKKLYSASRYSYGLTIYTVDLTTDKCVPILLNNPTPGFEPIGALALGSDNNLYGVLARQTYIPAGYIFSFNPETKEYKTEFPFAEGQGQFSDYAHLTEDITHNDPIVTIKNVTVYETDIKAKVMIGVRKPFSYPIRLRYKTVAGTATAHGPDRDYKSSVGYVKIPAGKLTGKIRILIRRDTLKEPDETFTVVLSKKGFRDDKSVIGDGSALVTIRDGLRPPKNRSLIYETAPDLPTGIIPKNQLRHGPALQVILMPNPSNQAFKVLIEKAGTGPIILNVWDVSGKIVESRRGIAVGTIIEFGGNYRPGVYYLSVEQPLEKRVFKLIKVDTNIK